LLFDNEKSGSVDALDVDSGKTSAVVAAKGRSADMGRISPDGRWVAFRVDGPAAASGLAITPFRETGAVSDDEWISISSHASDEQPAWSPDGRILYFTSSREGSRDIWMQRLDTATKQPAGEPRLVRRFPSIRHSIGMMTADDRRLAVTRDGLIFPMNELGGAVWLMTPK
jgi:Tol biopolymer transport system component